MPAGDAFPVRQSEDIERAIRIAGKESGLAVSVFVGDLGENPRARAQSLHAALPVPATTVLVAVDPGNRQLEIVTGAILRQHLDDHACRLAALSMTTSFSGGDLAGGIADGVRMLGEHARVPPTLHGGSRR